jgi:FkbM family methyltransferase
MKTQKYTIKNNANLDEIWRRLFIEKIDFLLVVDDNLKFIGVLGKEDIENPNLPSGFEYLNAAQLCNKNCSFVQDSKNSCNEALQLFYTHNFDYIPIVSECGILVDCFKRHDFSELQMITYCHCDSGEDIILNYVLRENVMKGGGYYVDVGANHPWYCSVTQWFYQNGWHGINIEPLEKEYKMLCQYRPRDINLRCAVSNENGQLALYSNEGGTTAVAEYANKEQQTFCVPMTTLKAIFEEHIPNEQNVHFLKIDVEGYEKNVLSGADFNSVRPWIIVIESTRPFSYIPSHNAWESILISNNYLFALQQDVNRYYVAKEHQYLAKRFIDLKSIRKRMKITEIKL